MGAGFVEHIFYTQQHPGKAGKEINRSRATKTFALSHKHILRENEQKIFTRVSETADYFSDRNNTLLLYCDSFPGFVACTHRRKKFYETTDRDVSLYFTLNTNGVILADKQRKWEKLINRFWVNFDFLGYPFHRECPPSNTINICHYWKRFFLQWFA